MGCVVNVPLLFGCGGEFVTCPCHGERRADSRTTASQYANRSTSDLQREMYSRSVAARFQLAECGPEPNTMQSYCHM